MLGLIATNGRELQNNLFILTQEREHPITAELARRAVPGLLSNILTVLAKVLSRGVTILARSRDCTLLTPCCCSQTFILHYSQACFVLSRMARISGKLLVTAVSD